VTFPLNGTTVSLSSASNNSGNFFSSNWSSQIVVYNFDVQGGFSYWFTPNWKLALSYRLDAFLNALRSAPDDGTVGNVGPGRAIDRCYHGPKITPTRRVN